ncbi:MAG TPA: hypothetical protein DGT21_17475 [Armatimonadetes bacterium]|jgi:hypothetical protein|nr:hypothetical protein [Armatimonadota bacterium]
MMVSPSWGYVSLDRFIRHGGGLFLPAGEIMPGRRLSGVSVSPLVRCVPHHLRGRAGWDFCGDSIAPIIYAYAADGEAVRK